MIDLEQKMSRGQYLSLCDENSADMVGVAVLVLAVDPRDAVVGENADLFKGNFGNIAVMAFLVHVHLKGYNIMSGDGNPFTYID